MAPLRDAADAIARPALDAMVQSVIKALQSMDAVGMFADVRPRHLWDEYCWQLQAGPFDNDDFGFGSTSYNFDEVLQTCINAEINKQPRAMHLCMGIFVQHESLDDEDFEPLSVHAVSNWMNERVNEIASARDLCLIGPDRADGITSYIDIYGIVAKSLEETGELSDLLAIYADDLLWPTPDPDELSNLADTMLDAFWAQLEQENSETSGPALSALLGAERAVKSWLLAQDIRPFLDDVVGQLQQALDEYPASLL